MTAGPEPADGQTTDAAGRERIRTSLGESLLVEAAAGTGKTTVLVQRLVAALGAETGPDGRPPDASRVVAVTFTRKAAGELKLRLRLELDRARGAATDDAVRARLDDAISRLEEAHIGTIHSFCAEILRQRPVEAAIDPAFQEMDDGESAALYERAFQGWIEGKLEEMPEALARGLARLAAKPRFDGASPVEQLRRAGRDLADWRDFDAPWRRDPFQRDLALNTLVDRLGALAEMAKQGVPRDPLHQALEPVVQLATWIERSEEASGRRDFDEIEALLVELLRDLRRQKARFGRSVDYAPGLRRRDVIEARDGLLEELEDVVRRADADLAAGLRLELRQVIDDYEALKHATGRLDFLDLLVRCRDLLRDRADVRAYFQERFSVLFVDEFQDTDPLQAEILLLLSADDPGESDWMRVRPVPGKLFLVGDPKQSIYRFRR
ncbi:MAG: UvrD-helicase domain-containing protein, partial [Acidobacteriota bacterium]